MAGNLTVERCGKEFSKPSRKASSNYGIGTDGRVGMYVEEHNRAWTSSNAQNDQLAVTIEVSNDKIGGDWHVSDKAYNKLIDLCVDICKRNKIEKLIWTGDSSGNLTTHDMFANTICPGFYLKSRMGKIAETVNNKLKMQNNNTNSNVSTQTKKTISQIVEEVIAGKWGNGSVRQNKLKAAGYDYSAIQKEVNKKFNSNSSIDIDNLAKRVIAGEFGNGENRKLALGKHYAEVQARVNELLKK